MEAERPPLHRPPLNLLVDPTALRRIRAWEVNIRELLERFRETARRWRVSLNLYGSAALASSILYRMKAETILRIEPPRQQRPPTTLAEPPLMLTLPFRQQLYTTSLEDLLAALERAILETSTPRPEAPEALAEAPPYLPADEFTLHILQHLDELRTRIHRLGVEASFRDLAAGLSPLEAVRIFFLLLVLASAGEVVLEQDEDGIRVMSVGPTTSTRL